MSNINIEDKDRILINAPENYSKIEIRNMNYDDGEGLTGYNGNVIIGYGEDSKDIFFLSANKVDDKDTGTICDKVEELFGQDKKLINLTIYNGDVTIYNINDNE